MPTQTLNIFTVEINEASGVQTKYVVSNVASQLAAIQTVFNNGLIPNDVVMIQCTLTSTTLVS